MTQTLYVYAVARAEQSLSQNRALKIKKLLPPSLDTICYRELVVIVEHLPAAAEPFLNDHHLTNPLWIKARILLHHQVHSRLNRYYAVIPAEFGMLFASKIQVYEYLVAQYNALHTTLAQIAEAAEWGVSIFSKNAQVRVASTQTANTSLLLNMQTLPLTNIGWWETARECHAKLSTCARVTTIHACATEPREHTLLLCAAYVVKHSERTTFTTTLAALEQLYEPLGLRFELSGPWPPALHAIAQPATTLVFSE